MDFLFHFQLLIGAIAQSHSVHDNKKADVKTFSQFVQTVNRSSQVMSPYTSNASDSHTVLHPLWHNKVR
jgi:hypothetical protein